MPGLTIATNTTAATPGPGGGPAQAQNTSQTPSTTEQQRLPRGQSPPPPPISPITPTLPPRRLQAHPPPPSSSAQQQRAHRQIPIPTSGGSSTHYTADPSPSSLTFFAQNRAFLTHTTQAPAAATEASALSGHPPPRTIDFDTSPDVLALKSAISILQIQRARAAADVARLGRAKREALDDPAAFLRDLAGGGVASAPAAPTLWGGADASPHGDRSEPDSDSDSDGDEGGDRGGGEGSSNSKGKEKEMQEEPAPPAWRDLPQRQNVVRCPPINWAQYAVVGESLDKLHNEQLTRPTMGAPAPAVVGPGGVFEFKSQGSGQGGGSNGSGSSAPGPRLVGVAAPYTLGWDKLEKKPKGARK